MEGKNNMNKFIYKIKTLEGYYFTLDNDEALCAWRQGATINCGRVQAWLH